MKRYSLLLVVLTLSLLFTLAPVQAANPSSLPNAAKSLSLASIENIAAIPVELRVKIDPDLLEQLVRQTQDAQRQGAKPAPITYLVHLREQAPLRDLSSISSQDKRRALLVERLQETARRSQSGVLAYLAAQQRAGEVARYRSYWVFNGLAVEGNLSTALALAQRPEVEAIRPNRVHRLSPPEAPAAGAEATVAGVEWNIARIGADRIWREMGFTGAGIVVANMDSGVDWTHPALQPRYRGYNPNNPAASNHHYNWFDATGTYPNAPGPNQPHITNLSDHGTHTMGTIVGGSEGGTAIGVAPGARWIATKVFDNRGNSTDEWIHAGFQWLLAPTDLNGQNPDPSKAPDIVCNSWGDDNGQDLTFRDDVNALRAAGIFTAWAAGNNGPQPGTIGSPASLENAFAVGAVDSQNQIASFSSRGPSPWGYIKPDVVAPGVNIRSTIAGGGYEAGWNGTSMATPHVAGLAALMWEADRSPALRGQSANPSLTVTSTEYIISDTALELGPAGKDNAYGLGLINAYEAVSTVIQGGTFAGRVTDAHTGLGMADVLLTMTSRTTGAQTFTHSDAQGYYSFTVAAGRYDVTATRFGYHEARVEDIQVIVQMTTQLDLELQPQPGGVLTGRVTRNTGGTPGAATVQVLDTPISTSVDAQGYYTLPLPVGTYTVRALPLGPGYRGEQAVGVEILADAQVGLDFALQDAPRLLLVDADAWQSKSQLPYYQAMLDNLCYGYDTQAITKPPLDIPDAALLAQYDLVIWSQPVTSPGYVGAWEELGSYLEQGGRLLLTGQDIGYWDVELGGAPTEYARYLHAEYQSEDGGLSALIGADGSALEGLVLTYNTPDSAQNQVAPDAIAPGDGLAAGAMASPAGVGAGLLVDACNYRAVYLGFGLEGMGPAAAREELLARLITWLDGERPAHAPALTAPVASRLAAIGSTARYVVWVANQGQTPDNYTLTVDSPLWSARLIDPRTGNAVEQVGPLAPCAFVELELQVEIPPTAVANEAAQTLVRAVSDASGIIATWTARTGAMPGWQAATPLPDARYRLAVAALDCSLLAVGGYGNDIHELALNRATRFDPATGAWTPVANKPTAAANSAIAVVNGLVYVLGGYDPDAPEPFLDDLEVYDPASDHWEIAPPLPIPLSGAAAAAYEGSIYLFGGSGPAGDSDATYRYDPQTQAWETRAPMPGGARIFARAVSLGEYIYVAGGWPNIKGLWRYHPATDTWKALAPMRVGRHSMAIAAQGNYLYVAGGGSDWTGLASAERYDVASDSWELLPALQDGNRAGAAGAWLDGRFYVVGGAGERTTAAVEVLSLAAPLGGSRLEVDQPIARAGDTLRYSLLVRNPVPANAAASWSLALPPQVAYVPGSATGGATYDAKARTLQWAGSVPGAGLLPFGFSATIAEDVGDGAVITATALLDGGGCAPAALSATTRAFVPSLAPSTKQVDRQEVAPGERLRYTITLANSSPFAINSASLLDPLPEHTTYVPGSATGGAVYNVDLRRIEWHGDLPPVEMVGTSMNWVDATNGEKLNLEDDTCVGPLDLGFEFEFYGKRYSQIYVNSNGMVLFDACSSAYNNAPIPSTEKPNNFIAPFWDDLTPNGGAVYWQVLGNAPRRYAVVEWQGVGVYSQSQPQTFEVILYEGSNRVVFQYLDMNGDRGAGSSASVGIENADGTAGVQYLYNGNPADHALHDGLVVEQTHSSTRNLSTHEITFDVLVDNPVPPATVITNTARIHDGRQVHERSAASVVYSPSFEQSSKQVQPTRPLSGEVVHYTLQIVNSGNAPAIAARLQDPLPAGLTLIPGSLQGAGATYNAAARAIEWQGQVPPGGAGLTITYQARVDEGLPVNTWLTNTATLSEQGVPVARLEAGALVNEVNLTPSTHLAHTNEVIAGEGITYTITLHNGGRLTATNVTMTDELPAALQLVEGTLEGGTYDAERHAIVWQGTLPPHSGRVVRFRANTLPNTPNGTIIVNTARIDNGHGDVIERPAEVRVLRGDLSESDMLVTPGYAAAGGTATYTLRVRNSGPVDIAGSLLCLPPEPLSVDIASLYASAGSIGWEDGVRWEGLVRAQGMVIVRLTVAIPKDAPQQTLMTEAHLVDVGGLETVLQADLTIGAETGRVVYLPMMLR
ncbi:MAG: S8 family serine peptidase [Chloroflexi bacterium]|nr:S8 family serine peptidase [Chloroflexota bacterium]